MLEGAEAEGAPRTTARRRRPRSRRRRSPAAAEPAPDADVQADVVVLGAGPGGYTAAFRAADLGLKTVLVERHERLGGVCLNVGCIPSKSLLHIARVLSDVEESAKYGITFGKPEIDIDALRSWKDSVVGKLTGGLTGLAKQRKVEVVRGTGTFTSPQPALRRGRGRHEDDRLQALHHRRGLEPDGAARDARGRPAADGLDRRARARRHPRAAARHRRRDHRPGDGDGLRRARLQGHASSSCSTRSSPAATRTSSSRCRSGSRSATRRSGWARRSRAWRRPTTG